MLFFVFFIKIPKFTLPGVMLKFERTNNYRRKQACGWEDTLQGAIYVEEE